MLAADRRRRECGLELLAIYHSHPAAEPVPSRRDVERNTYGESVVHLIVGLAGAKPEVRVWWLTETGHREASFEIARI
jgi:proteasome lid subunit RPN8/RPN11